MCRPVEYVPWRIWVDCGVAKACVANILQKGGGGGGGGGVHEWCGFRLSVFGRTDVGLGATGGDIIRRGVVWLVSLGIGRAVDLAKTGGLGAADGVADAMVAGTSFFLFLESFECLGFR